MSHIAELGLEREAHIPANRHLFIVIEGVDGVGKTTVAHLMAESFGAKYFHTPSVTLEQFHYVDSGNNDVQLKSFVDATAFWDPQQRFLFYLFAMAQASHELLQQLAFTPIICDRYLASTLAYHWSLEPELRAADLGWMKILTPDFQFLLTVDECTRNQRIRERLKERSDVQLERHHAFLDSVDLQYRQLNMTEVQSGNMNPSEIVAKLTTHVFNNSPSRLKWSFDAYHQLVNQDQLDFPRFNPGESHRQMSL